MRRYSVEDHKQAPNGIPDVIPWVMDQLSDWCIAHMPSRKFPLPDAEPSTLPGFEGCIPSVWFDSYWEVTLSDEDATIFKLFWNDAFNLRWRREPDHEVSIQGIVDLTDEPDQVR